MRGHPVVEAAAVALLCGWDPIRYASIRDEDVQVFASAVLERAAGLRAEEWKTITEAIGGHVGNRVAELLARILPR